MKGDIRLPATVQPETYILWLRPDLSAFTFQGREEVRIRIQEPTDRIVLHAAELEIASASVTLTDGRVMGAREIRFDPAAERASFLFEERLPRGTATLGVRFTGTLNDRLVGFYRSRFEGSDGKDGYMAATQFEATDARRAFPCWDEPAFKATFDVTLEIPREFVVLSNTPHRETADLGDGTKRVRFVETPRMSTYLLAFVVGPLEAIEAGATGRTKVGIWAAPEKVQYGRWALENGVRILDYLNSYYGIPYPLEKLDHIAISNFAAGAMENWGAITYRERVLLHDPASSSALTRQRIVDVMAHETAHMWFGDLVTMAWWDDLWLNESFASWMGTKTVDALYPDWEMWTQFLHADTIQGLNLDGLRSSHPIEVDVKDPGEIREIFDDISYSKGAAILWMLEQFLGEEAFRRGLGEYLKAHSYGNATTEDLWSALEAASGQPVRALMDSWVKQTGFPLLEAEVARSGGEARITLRQSRFLYEHVLGVSEQETRWKVPVHVRRAGGPDPVRFLMEEASVTRPLGRAQRPDSEDWIKVNSGQSGFYRTNYPVAEWERLERAVERQEMPPPDRLGLLDDAYALMRAGYLPATRFFRLARSYQGETDATVWRALSGYFPGLEALLAEQPYLDRFLSFGRELFRPIVSRVGWEPRAGEGHLDALLRTEVLSRLGHFGDEAVLREAGVRFRRYLEDSASLPPDLKDAVYGLVAQEADQRTYETLWELERKATLNEEKVRLLSALTRTRNPAMLRETLRRCLDEREVRSQDSVLMITGVATSRPSLGRDLAWEFVKANWTELYRRYARSGFMIQRIARVAEAFTNLERAREVETFIEEHPAPEARRAVQQSLERIRTNAAWLERNDGDLARWFRETA